MFTHHFSPMATSHYWSNQMILCVCVRANKLAMPGFPKQTKNKKNKKWHRIQSICWLLTRCDRLRNILSVLKWILIEMFCHWDIIHPTTAITQARARAPRTCIHREREREATRKLNLKWMTHHQQVSEWVSEWVTIEMHVLDLFTVFARISIHIRSICAITCFQLMNIYVSKKVCHSELAAEIDDKWNI